MRLPTAPTRSPARAATTEAAELYSRRPTRPRRIRSSASGPVSAWPRAGDVGAGAERVRPAIDADEGWRRLLARLEPEIAAGAPPVREALGVERAIDA